MRKKVIMVVSIAVLAFGMVLYDAIAKTTYFAWCSNTEGHLVAWQGPDRDTLEEAKEDGRNHDKEFHHGVKNATWTKQ